MSKGNPRSGDEWIDLILGVAKFILSVLIELL